MVKFRAGFFIWGFWIPDLVIVITLGSPGECVKIRKDWVPPERLQSGRSGGAARHPYILMLDRRF